MRFHICYNFVNCPNFKRTVLAGAQLTTENLQLTNRFRELTEGGVGKLHPFSIQNWTKILVSPSKTTIFPYKKHPKTAPKLSFLQQKLPFFHQNWTKTAKFPPKLSHLSIKTLAKMIEKHGKTYENTSKIVKKNGSTRNYIIKFPWFIHHGFSFCCTRPSSLPCQTMKILAVKRLGPVVNQDCKKPPVAVK